jgi:hypothetical protein
MYDSLSNGHVYYGRALLLVGAMIALAVLVSIL